MSSASTTATARNFFSKSGLLSRWHPNYEFREGQLEMAEAVETALAKKKHLIVEAGTGTGKTLAYLIPAILSGKRVVVSTGTKNLQEQIFFKDIPFLQQHFPHPLKVCYMKGRGNYACRQKIYDAQRSPMLSGLEEVTDFEIIREWEEKTEIGDRAEIHGLRESSTLWPKLDARGELCSGQKCQQFDRCFITKMHQRAHESDIIIVNHHLFFADLALKDEEFGSIIPEYAAVILDEAHDVEDIAGQYFGTSVSSTQYQDLRRDIMVVARQKKFGTPELDQTLAIGDEASTRFFSLFGEEPGRWSFRQHEQFLKKNESVYSDFLNVLDLISVMLQSVENGPDEVIPLFRRAVTYIDRLRFWLENPQPEYVYWVERRNRGVYLQATPIAISSLMEKKLFDEVDSVILTSATLAVSGGFQFTQERLGLKHARTLVVESPFNYEKQALLYAPQTLPDPRAREFTEAATVEIARILDITRGRAFVLFTSYAQMRAVYEAIDLMVEWPLMQQGSAPRSALLDKFRSTPNAVLFATSSFWQGVDVQGEQLSCVIIDKLPFAVPSDPVVEARIQALRGDGREPFYEYQIPQAAIALKQGFGRLIRSRSDRGLLCILDNRITKQRYGQVFFDSLPPYSFTTNLKDVEAFFPCSK